MGGANQDRIVHRLFHLRNAINYHLSGKIPYRNPAVSSVFFNVFIVICAALPSYKAVIRIVFQGFEAASIVFLRRKALLFFCDWTNLEVLARAFGASCDDSRLFKVRQRRPVLFARTKDRNFVRGLRVPLICPGEQNRHAEVTV